MYMDVIQNQDLKEPGSIIGFQKENDLDRFYFSKDKFKTERENSQSQDGEVKINTERDENASLVELSPDANTYDIDDKD